jgi:hypothetical protein
MTVATDQPQVRTEREPLRFTPEQYYSLTEQGVIREPTELVDGHIVTMPAQFHPAIAAIGRISRRLVAAWHDEDAVASDMTHPFPSGMESSAGRRCL